MAAPMEVALVSDAAGPLCNCSVWELHSGSALPGYRGGNTGPRGLALLGGEHLLGAQLGKSYINVWELQRKVPAAEGVGRAGGGDPGNPSVGVSPCAEPPQGPSIRRPPPSLWSDAPSLGPPRPYAEMSPGPSCQQGSSYGRCDPLQGPPSAEPPSSVVGALQKDLHLHSCSVFSIQTSHGRIPHSSMCPLP